MLSAVIRDMVPSSTAAKGANGGTRNGLFIVAALICVVMPFEISHLLFMFLGAALYFLATAPSASQGKATPSYARKAFPPRPDRTNKAGREKPRIQRERAQAQVVPPLTAPTLQSTGWEGEVAELLEQIIPTPVCKATVVKLARRVQEAVRPLHPGAQVTGYVNGSLHGGKAFGVAVPDVDIVVSLNPSQLVKKGDLRAQSDMTDPTQPLKCAVRACIDRLVNRVGLKFRRSAFCGREPKVTFLAPQSLGLHSEAIPLDFSINTLTPWRNAALIEALGQSEPRIKALVLLVKRWAKDRGICHAAKGHLPPYAWTLLCIYYLQAGTDDQLLAPIDSAALQLIHAGEALSSVSNSASVATAGATVAELLKGFMQFYTTEFDWTREVVCVRLGQRAQEHATLLPHIALCDDNGTTGFGPCVEDPFDQTCNLGDRMTLQSLGRLHEEFSRANLLCAGDASLSELLQPWVPPMESAKPE